jgi:hypothetical protein
LLFFAKLIETRLTGFSRYFLFSLSGRKAEKIHSPPAKNYFSPFVRNGEK